MMMKVTNKTMLDEVTSSQYSSPISIRNAKKVVLEFQRSSHSSGSAVFTVQGSIDGSGAGNMHPTINLIKNSPNNNVQTLTRHVNLELNSDSKDLYALDLEHFHYDFIMVRVVESGSGKSTVKALIVE